MTITPWTDEQFLASVRIVPDFQPVPEPIPNPPDWDGDDDGLGLARGLFSAVLLWLVIALFVWGVVEFCLHV